MILQLHGFPVVVNGEQKGAENNAEYQFVIREIRWILLNESDWMMTSDSPLSESTKQAWVEWRQMLRNLPTFVPEELGETFEISDPPVDYQPASWVNVTPNADWAKDHTH